MDIHRVPASEIGQKDRSNLSYKSILANLLRSIGIHVFKKLAIKRLPISLIVLV